MSYSYLEQKWRKEWKGRKKEDDTMRKVKMGNDDYEEETNYCFVRGLQSH